jgi:hypothetical protein
MYIDRSFNNFITAFSSFYHSPFSPVGLGVLFEHLNDEYRHSALNLKLNCVELYNEFNESFVSDLSSEFDINVKELGEWEEDENGSYKFYTSKLKEKVKNFLIKENMFVGETTKGFVIKRKTKIDYKVRDLSEYDFVI